MITAGRPIRKFMTEDMAETSSQVCSCPDELTDEIHINTADIPAHVRDNLAAATMELIYGILRQPGGREALDARTAARKATASAK